MDTSICNGQILRQWAPGHRHVKGPSSLQHKRHRGFQSGSNSSRNRAIIAAVVEVLLLVVVLAAFTDKLVCSTFYQRTRYFSLSDKNKRTD